MCRLKFTHNCCFTWGERGFLTIASIGPHFRNNPHHPSVLLLFVDLDNFPMMQRNAAESPKDHRRRRTQEYFHDTEMIFVLPSLEMCLRSIHTQGEHEPASDGKINATRVRNTQCDYDHEHPIDYFSFKAYPYPYTLG
jgi:hypothetical protein